MDSSTFRLADRAVTGNRMGRADATGVARWTQPVRAQLGPSRRRARRCRGARNDGDRKREQGASPTVGPAAARPLLRLLRHRARSAAVSGGRKFQSSPQAATYYGVSRPDTRFLTVAVADRRDATTLGLTPGSSSAVTVAIRKTTPARPRAVRPVQRHDNGHTPAATRLSAFMPDRHRRSVLTRRCLKRLDTAAAESSQLSEQIPARGSCTRLSARRARGSPRFGSTAGSRPRTTRTQGRLGSPATLPSSRPAGSSSQSTSSAGPTVEPPEAQLSRHAGTLPLMDTLAFSR